MVDIPEEAVKAAILAYQEEAKKEINHFPVMMRAALTAALPFLTVQGAVKKLEWVDADEGMCTKWRAAALGGHYELVDFGKDDPGFAVNFHWGRPLSFWFIQGDPDEWVPTGPKIFPTLEAAKAAAQADYEARILSAIEPAPSAARDLALDDKTRIDAATAALISLTEAGIPTDVQELLIVGDPSRGIAPGSLSKAIATVIRSISSPDHADAGKVDGDGWLPIDETAKSGRIVRIAYNRDDVTMADAFYRDGKWHAACVFYRSGAGKPPYEFREHKVLESLVFAYRPLPSAPSEGAE